MAAGARGKAGGEAVLEGGVLGQLLPSVAAAVVPASVVFEKAKVVNGDVGASGQGEG